MSRIAVLGSINMDLVVRAQRLPAPGETVLGESRRELPGGKGANQAIAAARMGAQVWFLGAVGTDSYAEPLRDRLLSAGVHTSELRTIEGPSGFAAITVNPAGENSIVVVPGANHALRELTPADQARIRDCDVLLLQLEVPISVVADAAEFAYEAGTTVMLNPSPYQQLPRKLLTHADVAIVNEIEAEQLGRDQERFRQLVITRGRRGAHFRGCGGESLDAPAPEVDVVDTTGAGDAFAGACAALWRSGPSVAVPWACTAGALAVTREGAYSPGYTDVAARMPSLGSS
ncbi:ribokinase [Hoyosella altamirensis]|uniref:Ribokinase n=1 Tax=Hoyosella altamirensis TaxID=616997 RepID=A0A839RQJ1_9ACTN|nr:ribokinase [Hoyosella altamirensis]MBB3039055.1 ribokinase [Hoyosella altamirensis]